MQVIRPHVVPARRKKQVADGTLPVMSANRPRQMESCSVRLPGSDTRREPQHGSQSGHPCLRAHALCNPACHGQRTAYRRNLRASSVSREDYEDGARGGQIPTVAVRFPGLDRRVRDGRPIRAQNAAFDVHVVALVLGRDRVAVLDCGGARRELLCMRNEVRALTIGRVVRVERPEHAAFRSAVDRRVVDRVDQGRDTQDVREQDEFLAERRALLPSRRQEEYSFLPFLCGQAARIISCVMSERLVELTSSLGRTDAGG